MAEREQILANFQVSFVAFIPKCVLKYESKGWDSIYSTWCCWSHWGFDKAILIFSAGQQFLCMNDLHDCSFLAPLISWSLSGWKLFGRFSEESLCKQPGQCVIVQHVVSPKLAQTQAVRNQQTDFNLCKCVWSQDRLYPTHNTRVDLSDQTGTDLDLLVGTNQWNRGC